MYLAIQSVNAYPNPGVAILVNDGHIHLNRNADFQWQLVDSGNAGVSVPARAALTPAQYSGWGTDDAYAARCVATNLGFTPLS